MRYVCAHTTQSPQPADERVASKESRIHQTVMHRGVASRAKRNQVLLRIITGMAAEFLVVDLKI
jgi:hypothetical protein